MSLVAGRPKRAIALPRIIDTSNPNPPTQASHLDVYNTIIGTLAKIIFNGKPEDRLNRAHRKTAINEISGHLNIMLKSMQIQEDKRAAIENQEILKRREEEENESSNGKPRNNITAFKPGRRRTH